MNFETQTCTRCHGTGEYSYCQYYGTRCFRCAGKKVTYTKRGLAAKAYFEKLCSVPINQLKPGDTILAHGITHGGGTYSYIATVTGIEVRPCKSSFGTVINGVTVFKEFTEELAITHTHPKYGHSSIGGYHAPYNHVVRVYNHPNKAEYLAKALEYQKTLTKQGTPRKSKAKHNSLTIEG